ncbi:N-acetyltransferase [Candidatus Magnetomoraceae bacterium gMMP-13]
MNTIDNHKLKKNNKLIKNIINDHVVLKIDIIDNKKQKIGYLCPITKKSLKDNKIIQKLTDWRNFHRKSFLTQFVATYDRTKNWLEKFVLTDYYRLLFLIYTNKKLIGHSGFINLTNSSVEGDNLIRGEIGGGFNFIYYAQRSKFMWIFNELEVDIIYGKVLTINKNALKIHNRVGFILDKKMPVYFIEKNGEHFMEKWTEKSGHQPENMLYYTSITKERFFEQNFLSVRKKHAGLVAEDH